MLSDKTSVEVCLSTFCLSVTFIGLIIYGTVVKQCKWIVIQNVRNVELFLLCIVYVIFSLLNKIICWHIKKKLETQKNQPFFEFLFIDIEIVSKLIWALSADNEFIFLFCSNILSFHLKSLYLCHIRQHIVHFLIFLYCIVSPLLDHLTF